MLENLIELIMNFCESCGMPLEGIEDLANGDENSRFCHYCLDDKGRLKPVEEIFESGVEFFMSQLGGDRQKAEKITRKNMIRQPYWQGKDFECLKGEMATDEEFEEVIKQL